MLAYVSHTDSNHWLSDAVGCMSCRWSQMKATNPKEGPCSPPNSQRFAFEVCGLRKGADECEASTYSVLEACHRRS